MHEIDILHTIVKSFGASLASAISVKDLNRMYPVTKIAITLHRFVANRLKSSLLRNENSAIVLTIALSFLLLENQKKPRTGISYYLRYKFNLLLDSYINNKNYNYMVKQSILSLSLLNLSINNTFVKFFLRVLLLISHENIVNTLQYFSYAFIIVLVFPS